MGQFTTAASYSNVQELANELGLSEQAYERALQFAELLPSRTDWLRHISRFLAVIGALLIVAGIAAFFAWNWADLGYMTKFVLIQSSIVAAAVLAWRLGIDTIGGRASLFSSAFLVGVLLAVYGQVYQTGADPYGLFLGWAILILPWVIVGRQAALWILLQALLNLSLIMYWTQVIDPPGGLWQLSQLLGPLVWLSSTLLNSTLASLVFALNTVALIAWENAANRDVEWVQDRTYPRIMAFVALSNVLIPTVVIIFGESLGERVDLGVISPVLYAVASAAAFYYYQHRRPDLLMLTMCVFAAVLVATSVMIRFTVDDISGALFLAILLIAQVAGAAYWLRNVSRKWEEES
ncbi:MAG: DUF2157 domain-containing protein [Gammaproteobacteria bacterium]|nr:DUF2157 domain-containing protein [Gammaproteobacteria bacterium]